MGSKMFRMVLDLHDTKFDSLSRFHMPAVVLWPDWSNKSLFFFVPKYNVSSLSNSRVRQEGMEEETIF